MSQAKISEVFSKIVHLAQAVKAKPMNKYAACWEHRIDDDWSIAVNGHPTQKETEGGCTVPPFSAYIEWNGFPAGILGMNGGMLVAGSGANEDTLIEALDAAIAGAA